MLGLVFWGTSLPAHDNLLTGTRCFLFRHNATTFCGSPGKQATFKSGAAES